MVCDVFELQDPRENWLIIVAKRSGESIHGHVTTHSVIAITSEKTSAQVLVEALRKHFNLV